MALGGGSFTLQNKVLPGSYINFVSAANASPSLSERGTATMPLDLDWGPCGSVFEVSGEDFQKYSGKIFGYDYSHDKLKGLRDLFMGAKKLFAFRLNSGGTKAQNTFASAKYEGIRGNSLKTVISPNVNNPELFDVSTYLDNLAVETQTVKTASELVSNDYIDFKSGATLAANAGEPLSGGENGEITGASYQDYLAKIESYQFNVMGADVQDDATKKLFVSFNKRLRDEVGAKFQLVLHDCPADYMGVINVVNTCEESESALVYWVTGTEAGCEINRSVQNKIYNGEFTPNTDYTQSQLINSVNSGEFIFHNVGSTVRVLEDINSMVTTYDGCGDLFKDNQTVRVIDQIANDIAVLFNTKYLGVVPNDNAGRVSLWSDIVKHHNQLRDIRAIENFSDSDVTVYQGNTKKSVVVNDCITVVNAMSKLYMTVTVS